MNATVLSELYSNSSIPLVNQNEYCTQFRMKRFGNSGLGKKTRFFSVAIGSQKNNMVLSQFLNWVTLSARANTTYFIKHL